MLAHDLARRLLEVPNFPVHIAVDDQYGLLSECEDPTFSHAQPWEEDPDYLTTGDEPNREGFPVVILSPKRQA